MDNHRLDKMHLVRCYQVDNLDRLRNVPEEYVQPEKVTFDEEVRHILSVEFYNILACICWDTAVLDCQKQQPCGSSQEPSCLIPFRFICQPSLLTLICIELSLVLVPVHTHTCRGRTISESSNSCSSGHQFG